MQLRQNQREWEDLAELDPQWAILSSPGRRDGGWQADAFDATGDAEIEALMQRAAALGLPLRRRSALDFGCGVGRLSRPLARSFDRCVGADISEQMIAQARRRSAGVANLEFVVNRSDKLPSIADGAMDLVLSRIVLQHVASRSAIRSYLTEFARVLAPGGLLVFQLPSRIPLRHRWQPRPRLYSVLRRLGVPATFLYRRLRLQPIRMRWIAADVVTAHLAGCGLELLACETERVNTIDSTTYYVTRPPARPPAAAA